MGSTTGRALRALTGACVLTLLATGTSGAQTFPGDPKPDLNIVGPTRDPADIRDEGLKQQNEPACAMRPGDGDCIICFFNDYRTVDILGHEDAWIGQAESCDAANTWTSRVVPGHPNHPAPIGTKFAADPRAIALPGMAIHGFIGGFRDQDRGVIAVQHWLENNKDDFDYYEPGLNTLIVDEGTEGRFIDKPDFLAVLDKSVPQRTVTLTTRMENPELGSITRSYPAGTLYAAYAVFTGSNSVKLLVKTSDDWGVTWRNKTTKLTESQNLVTGITMTSINDIVIAMWRQVTDNNDVDAIYYATTTNDGQNWSKPTLLTDICKFDQPSATFNNQVTFRTNDFPWLANDGKNIYAFFTERLGGCATGAPKVVMKYSADGVTWSPTQQVSDHPGAQFMPAAFGARGKVQVAWYDTRREAIPLTESQPFIADFIPETGVRVNRKVDVFTARVTSDASGGNVQVSDSIQVNRYRAVASASDPNGPLYEVEASFANAMMYKSGLLAFMGDYFAVTAPEFRRRQGGGWEENYSALPPPAGNLVDFFIAYADHRDVRGDILFGDGGATKPYTPPVNAPESTADADSPAQPPETEEQSLVASATANEGRQSAEGIEDDYTDPAVNVCTPGTFADRTRDANIYGTLVRDRLRLSSPVESRPLSGILRAIPFGISNIEDEEKSFRLFIANQPDDDPLWHRASFRQQPDRPPFPLDQPPVVTEDVIVKPNSSVARTVFVQSTNLTATVDVQIFDGACAAAADGASGEDPLAFTTACHVLGSITVGGVSTAGDIQQPDYLSTVCASDPECDVLLAELHNPLIENPLIENPLIENPLIENPLIENPLIENPLIENPLIENYGFENPLIENPLIENPLIENPLIENPLIENPLIENPLIENSALADGVTYTDITVVVRNDGNVTTAYNVDGTVAGFSSTAGDDAVSQLILWKQYVYGTARDCIYVPEARDQVVATINQPDNVLSIASVQEPFAGEGSIILAPGEQGFATFRLWGTVEELENARLSTFAVSSQASNCSEFDDEFGPPPGEEDNFYSCEEAIATNRELAVLQLDTTPPTFTGLNEGQVIPVPAIEANTQGGACVDPVASGIVSATDDSGEPVNINCFNDEGDQICSFIGDSGLSVPVANLVSDPGPSPMTCVASDSSGNFASVNLFVEVLDTSAPYFTSTAGNPTVVQAGETTGTAQVALEDGFLAEDVDGVDPSPVISCETTAGLTSADELPAGENDVICTVTDASGNFSTSSYVVRVDDVTHPRVTLTGDNPQAVQAGTPYVELGATATDNVGVVGGISIDASAVDTSMLGDYLVTYTAVDAANNMTTAIRTVSVIDTLPPAFDGPLVDITMEAMPDGTVTVTFVATASDSSGIAPSVTCSPPSGSTFDVGTTSVTCTATDAAGNSVSETFDVIVVDSTPPTLSVPVSPVIEAATGPAGAIVNFAMLVSATDAVDAAPAITCVPPSGSTFPVGTSTVTCEATDAAGNTATGSFVVTVVDGIAPTLNLPSSPLFEVLQGPDGAVVEYASRVSATDLVDPSPSLTCTPASGTTFAPGETVVSCSATDFSGNTATGSFTVLVGYLGFGIVPTKLTVKSGSSNPLMWAWRDGNGNNLDSSGDRQRLRIVDCDDPAVVILDSASDPGASGFRFKVDLSWEFNWQSAYEDGSTLPNGDFCASVTNQRTGQSLESPPIRVR